MGNILISQQKMDQWREEDKRANDLLSISAVSEQEKTIIQSARTERNIKTWCMVALGFSFGLSLQRYFPGTLITQSNPFFALAVMSIMFPCYAMGKIYTNREVIDKLHLIEIEYMHKRKRGRNNFN